MGRPHRSPAKLVFLTSEEMRAVLSSASLWGAAQQPGPAVWMEPDPGFAPPLGHFLPILEGWESRLPEMRTFLPVSSENAGLNFSILSHWELH